MSRNESPGLVFVSWVEHAQELAATIAREWVETHGPTSPISVPVVTSATSRAERKRVAEALANGSLRIAVCTDVWATGIDIPPVGWIINAGAGRAPIGLCQRGGRPTRLSEGKEEYIIYDILDASPHYEVQALERAAHYADAGFNVDREVLARALAKRKFGEENADAQLDRNRLDDILSGKGGSAMLPEREVMESACSFMGDALLFHIVAGFVVFVLIIIFSR